MNRDRESTQGFAIALRIALLGYIGFIGKETAIDVLSLLTHTISGKSA
jgi:hypothetical protein